MRSTDVNVSSRMSEAWRSHGAPPKNAQALRTDLAHGSLVAASRRTARRHPHREAFRIADESVTHQALDRRSRRLASALRRRTADQLRRVMIVGPNCIDLVVSYLAALRAGASVTFASPTLTPTELATLVDMAEPDVVIASADAEPVIAARQLPVLRLGDGPGSVTDAVRTHEPGRDAPVRNSDPAHLAFTSGTTGTPKATPLAHANVLASVRAVVLAWGWNGDDVLVHGLPLQHAHGLTAVHLTLLTGSRSVILPSFSADHLLDEIIAEHATVLFGVPATHEALLATGRVNPDGLSSLRLVTSGSAPLSPQVSDALTEAFGSRPLERYGLTEAGFVLSNPYAGPRLAGYVGLPLPGIEVDLVDAHLETVPDGADGEIVVRGPQVFAGYLGDRPSADDFTPGGWFRTGDLARRDPESGTIAITGRLKELIITGGMNVYPREVELAIEEHDQVSAAAVVGVPSPRWGEEVVAYIEADADIDTDELMRSLRNRLAGYKRPKRYVVVDRLPRNHLGKVLKSLLPD